jgi:hypothetical protein
MIARQTRSRDSVMTSLVLEFGNEPLSSPRLRAISRFIDEDWKWYAGM